MNTPAQLSEAATKVHTQTLTFFKKIRKQKPSNLDVTVQSIHDQIFENVDCLQCANCCKTTSPIFYQRDIERAAKALRITPKVFIDKYLHIDGDLDYVLNISPCPFLNSDNYCAIYADRPVACREYPHTNRKRFIQLLDLTLKNTHICPAVFEIVEKLKLARLK